MTAFDKAWEVVKGRFGAPDYHTIKRPSKPVVRLESGYVDPNNYEDGKSMMADTDNPDDPNSLAVRTSMAEPRNLDLLMESADPNKPYAHLDDDMRQHYIEEMERDVIAGKPRYVMRMPRPDEEEETEQRRQEVLAGEWDNE